MLFAVGVWNSADPAGSMSEKKCFYRVVVDFIIVLIPFKLSLVFNDFQSSFLSERERERERRRRRRRAENTKDTH